jgi:hypothetical protein
LDRFQLRFSLQSALIGLTIVSVLCALFMLSDIGYEYHHPMSTMNDDDELCMVQEGYGTDPLNLRENKLVYLFIGIAPKNASMSMRQRAPSTRSGRLTTFIVDGEPIELPGDVQLIQVEHGELKMFDERITLEQWLSFKNAHSGVFRIEDLLDYCHRDVKSSN